MSLARCAQATESLPLTIDEEMEEMLLRLGFSQTVAMKLVKDQEASLDRGNCISILEAKNWKLVAFMFKTMECCSKAYDIKHVNGTYVLQYHHQWNWNRRK